MPARQVELSWQILVGKGVCKGKNLRGETDETFIARQTHLSLNGRRLRSLGTALSAAPKTQVLYLFDNELLSLGGLAPMWEIAAEATPSQVATRQCRAALRLHGRFAAWNPL